METANIKVIVPLLSILLIEKFSFCLTMKTEV